MRGTPLTKCSQGLDTASTTYSGLCVEAPPVKTVAENCADATGASASGSGCLLENRNGTPKWKLSCDDKTSLCDCEKDGATVWSGRSGTYQSCSSDDPLWAACCGR